MAINRNKAGGSGATAATAMLVPDTAGLLRELQEHQLELEMQNGELRRAQLELATARDRYRDLYDRAPVGYLTLDPAGRILEANLTCARLLGMAQRELIRRPLSACMVQADADRWRLQMKQAFRQCDPWCIELGFRRRDGSVIDGRLDGMLVSRNGAPPCLRVTLTDVTQHRLADADRRAALQMVAEQEAERRRLARELHDDLGQRLSALKMKLAASSRHSVTDLEVAEMSTAIDHAVASVRRMAGDLRPLMLDDLGLGAAIEAMARHLARQHGLKLSMHLTALDPLPGDPAAVTLYRLLQASLPVLVNRPGVWGLQVELCDEPGALVLSMQSRCRTLPVEASPPDPAARWTVLRETAHLMGCAFDVAVLRGGGERVMVRTPRRSGPAVDDSADEISTTIGGRGRSPPGTP